MKRLLPIFAVWLACPVQAQSGDVASAQAYVTVHPEARETPAPAFELISFVASPVIGEGVSLRWSTGAEVPNNTFVIQRSRDRMNWRTAFVHDGEGAGYGFSAYEVMDMDPIAGISYYRLVASSDGHELEMSDEFAVEYAVAPELRIEGDNIPGRFSMHGSGPISGVQLLNNRGQFMPMELNYTDDGVFVRAENLEPGTYYVHATVNGKPMFRPVMITPSGIFGG